MLGNKISKVSTGFNLKKLIIITILTNDVSLCRQKNKNRCNS